MTKIKILIIGAGIAGLAAAQDLIHNGFDVTILEARSRLGGRIYPDNSLGLTIGRGATWIHGIVGNPIANLAHQFHAPFAPMDVNRFYVYDRQGQKISTTDLKVANQKLDHLIEQAKQYALSASHDMALADALAKFID